MIFNMVPFKRLYFKLVRTYDSQNFRILRRNNFSCQTERVPFIVNNRGKLNDWIRCVESYLVLRLQFFCEVWSFIEKLYLKIDRWRKGLQILNLDLELMLASVCHGGRIKGELVGTRLRDKWGKGCWKGACGCVMLDGHSYGVTFVIVSLCNEKIFARAKVCLNKRKRSHCKNRSCINNYYSQII